MPRPQRTWLRTVREWVLLICGLLGVAHEELVAAQPRPYLLLAYLAMMGLSAGLEDLLALLGVSIGGRGAHRKPPPDEPDDTPPPGSH